MNTILFDLDGTLIDSSEGIIKSVLYTLDFYGIEETDTTKLYQFIGPPLSESFEKFYGFSKKKAYEAVQKYRERYNKTGIFECKLYPGVEKCIRTLKEQGYRIGMASSKPEVHVLTTLQAFGIDGCFDYICGGSLDESRCVKYKVIEELLHRLNLPEEEMDKVLMVGDRKHDVEGAAVFHIPCLGNAMGFAPKGELEAAGAIGVVHSMKELTDYILAH